MSLFKQPSELEVSTTIKALIYGQPGLGKVNIRFVYSFSGIIGF